MSVTVVNQFPAAKGKQLAGSNRLYELDVSPLATPAWQANISIAANSLLRPTYANQTGFVYQAGANGETNDTEPTWPTTAGQTVVDGSVTWTAIQPPAVAEDSISSVTWTQVAPPDATLTIASQSLTGLTCQAYLGGGTSGNTYDVRVTITMASGAIYKQQILVSIL